MQAKKFARPNARRNVLAVTLARFVGERRLNRLRDLPVLHRFAVRKGVQTPDPVSLAILAIDRVGPAAVRACASGVEVRVAAPDEATARVLRQALAQTARRRDTDRLIRIIVD